MTEPFLGVVCGMQAEVRCLRPLLNAGIARVAVAAGDAERAEREALDHARAGAAVLMSFGIAAGLDPALSPGDLVVATRVIAETEETPTDTPWADDIVASLADRRRHVRFGPVLGVDDMLIDPAHKAALGKRTGALAADMESHGVAHAARTAGLPLLVIRAVADPVTRALPPAALAGMGPEGEAKAWTVTKAALQEPRQIPALMRLGSDTGRALRRLREVARHLRPALLRIV